MRDKIFYHLLGLNHPYELAHYSSVPEVFSNDSSCAFLNATDRKDIRNIFSYSKPSSRVDFDYEGDVDLPLLVKNLKTLETFAGLSDWEHGVKIK